MERVGVNLPGWDFFRRYECLTGDAYPNTKYIYRARIDRTAEELTLYEGQRLVGIEAR